ncbi:MAG: 30S ribosomal protein S20 [Candidatus Sungbacteria bacterium]|uniref:Small ribosomal subunit protein bS20 n=1 Tax=Candidatus Sungiibacteriota bacterium TaxID=2750080 RepID=A0A9D6LRB0_9BACT|nr:30S ribosomal protein S20 [Candidatus Sungbacteria bacterium]
MPITKSAEKALRQSIRRRARNTLKKDAFRTAIKNVRGLAAEKKKKEIEAAISAAYKALDKAAKTNVISKNTAARKKSRLVKFVARTLTATQ